MVKHMNNCDEYEMRPYQILNCVEDFFDYDHEQGRLRWTIDHTVFFKMPNSMRKRINSGDIAGGRRCDRDYEIKIDSLRRNALPLIWEHQTGIKRNDVMTIAQGETRFCIDNLCVVPRKKFGHGAAKVSKYRARGLTVVSWSYEHKQYTVVEVDHDYNKTVLSYHKDIDDAFEALKNPIIVSFL